MSEAPYSPLVIDHFEQPRNVGRFAPAADVIAASAGNAAQGARFDLSARVRDDRIAAVRFEAYGCPHCIAAGSLAQRTVAGSDAGAAAALELARDCRRRWSSRRRNVDDFSFSRTRCTRWLTTGSVGVNP